MQKKHTIPSFVYNAIRPFKLYVGLHLFVVLYNAVDLSLWPYVSKVLVDKIASNQGPELFVEVLPVAVFLIILTILPGFIWRLSDYAWAKMNPGIKKKVTTESMDYVMKHSHSFFQNNFAGSTANRIKDLATCTNNILEKVIYNFFNVILSLIIAFFAMLSVHKIFALGMLVWAVLFILIAIRGAKITNDMSIAIAEQQTKITGNLVDILSNVANVKFFSRGWFEHRKISNLQDDYTKFSERRNFFLIKFYTVHGLTFSLYFSFSIIALVWLYSQGLVTLGDFIFLIPLNSFMIHLMWMAANEMRNFLEDVGTMNQALEIINLPWKVKDAKNANSLVVNHKSPGEIIFDNVNFTHHNNTEALFTKKSVIIESGEKVGLVGHSGSGKSTFVNLILRLYDIDSGRIMIDGQDISLVTQDSLRNAISIIPQDPSLFHRTLFENIIYGLNKKDMAAAASSGSDEMIKRMVINACKKAHAHEFIMQLPHGYNSIVGDRGIKLSGGERQRIAIARAFLKNSPILILDEATSSLDSVTEVLIQESLEDLMQHRTTIVIAHRLSTLRSMDRILVFDHGRIVEDGNHEELIGFDGTYRALWESQVDGFILD